MINKIRKIKYLGIFKDYSWESSLPDFKRYNLFYGFNGSGKTTLSNLFTIIDNGTSTRFLNVEYEIEDDGGIIKKGESLSRKIRVFNQDYITRNIQVLTGKAKPIFILGEENKVIAEKIKNDEQLLLDKEKKITESTNNIRNQKSQKDKKFTDIASTISMNTAGTTTRTYRKPNAESAFQKLTTKEMLTESEINKLVITLQQNIQPTLKELTIGKLKYQKDTVELALNDLLEKMIDQAIRLCSQTVNAKIIVRLKQNNDISTWVEQGISLHRTYKSEMCEYCSQPLPAERIKELVNHFNEADKTLKKDIDILINELTKVYSHIETIKAFDKANLYDEIQSDYQTAVQTYDETKIELLENINNLKKFLNEKKAKTTESVNLEFNIDATRYITSLSKINIEIQKHNAKTNKFKEAKENAQKVLEKHYLSTIFDEIKALEKSINECNAEINKVQNGDPSNPSEISLSNLKERIKKNKEIISSKHKGCKYINEKLKTFLGRDEIVFETEEEGYIIKRNGEIAADLSEGEKNAIAFIYFTVHLQDQDFDIKEGIIVVDDPVSSLDSNSLFQAFAFLKNTVKDAYQVFLFTHNFDFMRLLLGWLNYRSLKANRCLYMIKNFYVDGSRIAKITILDKLLQEHESEYHYLFKRLYSFESEGTIESVYDIPNLARKVLDTFLMFRVPNNKSIYEKLHDLNFDDHKKAAIYKFTNDQSHITGGGFDLSLVEETQKNAKYLLEMMEKIFPEHFKILVESIN